MDLCNESKVRAVITVVPDPSKDIGFDLMGIFHYTGNVATIIHGNLAEAVGSLIDGRASDR